MATFGLRVGAAADHSFQAFDFETLEELEEALLRLLDGDGGALPELAFCPRTAPPYTVPEAFEVAVKVLGPSGPAEVRCVFASERARAHAARMLPSSERPRLQAHVGRMEIEVGVGDITSVRADAIVNASNTRLVLGSGVSGAIRGAASNPDALQAAMLARAPIAPGGVVTTSSWLPDAPLILHAATASGGEDVVRRALLNVLEACAQQGLADVAIPALGCGTGGLSVSRFGAIAAEVLAAHPLERPKRALFVLFDASSFTEFCDQLQPSDR